MEENAQRIGAHYNSVNEKFEQMRKGLRIARATSNLMPNMMAQLYTTVITMLDQAPEQAVIEQLPQFRLLLKEVQRHVGDIAEGLNMSLVAIADLQGPTTEDQVH